LVHPDALVDLVGKLQLLVRVAGVRVVGVRAELEALLALVPQDLLLLPQWALALLLHLLHHSADLPLVRIMVLRQELYELIFAYEVTSDHGEDQPAVVANVLAILQCVKHVAHHRALTQIFYRHA
jgi:hypothetical protein